MFSKNLENVLSRIFRDANSDRREFVTVEHLLLGLTDDDDTRGILEHAGGEIDQLRKMLIEHIDAHVPILPNSEKRETQPTLAFQRVLQRAVFHVQSSRRKEVWAANVLVAIFSESDCEAVSLLKPQGINRIDISNQIALNQGLQDAMSESAVERSTPVESRLDKIEANLDQANKDLAALTDEVKRIASRLDPDQKT